MIPIIKGSGGSEGGLLALLDLIANPKRVPDMKATLKELVQARDAADEALSKANELNASMMRRIKELDAQEATLKKEREVLEVSRRALEQDKTKHDKERAQFKSESEAQRTDLSARAVAIGSAEQSISSEREALRQREQAIGPREQAAQAIKTEYERKLAGLKALTGQL